MSEPSTQQVRKLAILRISHDGGNEESNAKGPAPRANRKKAAPEPALSKKAPDRVERIGAQAETPAEPKPGVMGQPRDPFTGAGQQAAARFAADRA